MITTPMTDKDANAVYDVLVAHAGATECGREGFVYLQTERPIGEYRFMGSLGYGGKFRRDAWIHGGDIWTVTAYPEDIKARPAIGDAVAATNAALAALIDEGANR